MRRERTHTQTMMIRLGRGGCGDVAVLIGLWRSRERRHSLGPKGQEWATRERGREMEEKAPAHSSKTVHLEGEGTTEWFREGEGLLLWGQE